MKLCNNCQTSKPLDGFNNKKSAKDGKRYQCRDCENAYSRSWKAQNPDKHREANKRSYNRLSLDPAWRESKAAYWREQREGKPELFKKISKRYIESHKHTEDYKIRNIVNALNRRAKTGHKSRKVLYSASQLRSRLEMNFKPGMSWDNWGEWHVDHTKPVSRFLKQGIYDITVINCLANLRPMWAKENISKGAKF